MPAATPLAGGGATGMTGGAAVFLAGGGAGCAGVVGAGGAGFPTHVKLAARADTLLLNAAECEPLLHKDKEVLREYADFVSPPSGRERRAVGGG